MDIRMGPHASKGLLNRNYDGYALVAMLIENVVVLPLKQILLTAEWCSGSSAIVTFVSRIKQRRPANENIDFIKN